LEEPDRLTSDLPCRRRATVDFAAARSAVVQPYRARLHRAGLRSRPTELFMSDTTNKLYRIEVDISRRLLKITLRGAWDMQAVDRYGDALAAAEAKLAMADSGSKEALILIDVRELQIQQQDVAEHYRKLAVHTALPPGKLAMVLTSGLLKLQMKRMGTGRQRFFESEDAAIEWLMSP
jgi:hypothetical protein